MLHILLYNCTAGKLRITSVSTYQEFSKYLYIFKSAFYIKFKHVYIAREKMRILFRSLQTNKLSNNKYNYKYNFHTAIIWKILLTDGDLLYQAKSILLSNPHYHCVSELTMILYNEINGETGSLLSFFSPEECHIATRHNFIVTTISDSSASKFMAPPLGSTWLAFCVPHDDYRFLMW